MRTIRLAAMTALSLRAIWAGLAKSDSLRSAIGFGAGGIGFAAGNIVLARVLPQSSYGLVALVLALNQFGMSLGPWGLDIVVNRHRPRVSWRLARFAITAAGFTALAVALIAVAYYRVDAVVGTLMFVMVVGSAISNVCVAVFQSAGRLRAALALSQANNYALLITAVLVAALSLDDERFIVGMVTAGYVLSAAIGWWATTTRLETSTRTEIDVRAALKEGLSALGTSVAVLLLSQCERLVIPVLGSLEMLGAYAALASVVGSPFRMIQIGAGFSLLPRLRASPSIEATWAILFKESMVALAISLSSMVFILLVAPFIFDTLLNAKYKIGTGLVVSSILVGLVKVWQGLSTTVVSACGSARQLALISLGAWMCLLVAIAGMAMGSRYGLVGIIYGVGIAWVLLALGGSYLALASIRTRFAVPSN